jgi:acetylornithine deacetylase/succinyl-diaminopimelate desuccinylase-like protein
VVFGCRPSLQWRRAINLHRDPGAIDQAHTADEFIELAALRDGADFFTRFIRGLADESCFR